MRAGSSRRKRGERVEPVPDAQLGVLVGCGGSLLRAGYRALLLTSSRLAVAGEADTGDEVVRLARQLGPDAVLLHVGIADCDCVETVRRLRADPSVPVVVLSATEDDERVFGALRAGATGVLSEDATAEGLVRAVEVAARGDAVLSPGLMRHLIVELISRPEPSHPAGELLAGLTPREREVVRLVARGLSNAEIAERLVLSPATARTHVSRAMVKLGARDRAQLVVFAYQSELLRQPSRGEPTSAVRPPAR
jgi:DNA-binding NarL/FixJ family response regulator